MIVAAAVCPHPPLLVPELAPGTTDELAALRQACDDAVAALLASGPDRIVVIGAGDDAPDLGVPDLDASAGGSLAGYGVDARAGGDDIRLPLTLTIGAWLLDRAGWAGARTYSTGRPPADGDVALLVMADGANGRSEKAPGFLDDRAAPYDATIVASLATGDAPGLAGLDASLGAELGAAGVASLRMLGALAQDEMARGATVTARLRYDGAPLGVGYVVADWQFVRRSG